MAGGGASDDNGIRYGKNPPGSSCGSAGYAHLSRVIQITTEWEYHRWNIDEVVPVMKKKASKKKESQSNPQESQELTSVDSIMWKINITSEKSW